MLNNHALNSFNCVGMAVLTDRCLCRHAWDMAADVCLAQIQILLDDPTEEFQVIFDVASKMSWSRRRKFGFIRLVDDLAMRGHALCSQSSDL